MSDPKRRGGRKPGVWTLVTPKAIADFRAEHQVSRARMADALGVSATSVQNWEIGAAVAVPRIQKNIAELIAAGPAALGSSRAGEAVGLAVAAQMAASGQIVAAYVTGRAEMTEGQVVSLIRAVRGAMAQREDA